ncbi:hypothetical protein [Brevundimonas bullata]|jgi:hypothetical protein|uniref:hypothetical protein n=1 Tax=Brevundimonas bullata TaxID=13160 RepID=UPI003D9A0EA2
MSKPFKPVATVASLKRMAHHIKVEEGVTQSVALDRAAQRSGYENYAHARRMISARLGDAAGGVPPQRPPARRVTAFQSEARGKWERAVVDPLLGPLSPTRTWDDVDAIVRVLNRVLGATDNHALLPTGGGMDLKGAARSQERGCLELRIRDRHVYVVKPRRLVLESFPDALAESFFILEADPLDLVPIDDERFDDDYDREIVLARRREGGRQEVLELEPGVYQSRAAWDEGILGHDGDGEEIPLPSSARLMVRWLRGRFMILSTGSLWNGVPATYDGGHDRMTDKMIRDAIQYALDELGEAA